MAMRSVSEKSKAIYLIILIVFVTTIGLFWLDYIGLINLSKIAGSYYKSEPLSVMDAMDDEPSLIEKEEFEKEKEKLLERIEELDRREAEIVKSEDEIEKKKEELKEIREGLELEKKRLGDKEKRFSGYRKNVVDLAQKIGSMRPDESVQIMLKWEDPLIIDVLRQMDVEAVEAGKGSITSYLISLMPRERASRIMYLMTQL